MERRAFDSCYSVGRRPISTYPLEPRLVFTPSRFDAFLTCSCYSDSFNPPQRDIRRFVYLRCRVRAASGCSSFLFSTIGFLINESGQRPGSLFATRSLPRPRPRPHPPTHPHPTLGPSEWLNTPYQRGNKSRSCHPGLRDIPQLLNPVPPSPLATSSDRDDHGQW